MTEINNAKIETKEMAKESESRLSCQICSGQSHDLFYNRDSTRLLCCQTCKLIFLDPLPTPEEIDKIYDDLYKNASTGYFAKVDKKLCRSRLRVRLLKRYVSGGRFLDVGCNGGFMVEAAREAGFEAFGVELDRASIDYAHRNYPNNTYFLGPIEAFAKNAQEFSAVYCSEVIEHVPDLNGFVAAIALVMKPGAVLYITTPDISHWRRPKNLEAWDGFDPPDHCIYFNPSNFSRLLASHGLEVFHRQFAWKPGIKVFARKRDK
ncbi:MAG: hypothetical protein A3A73_03125 [Omnitrophica bacterium RIFCSPLOWO2_01_FULL_50_24]|nr:MAG: hypothetical protein A3A73_03125 [Omnitrophica bacterium RIFCSPLOWO2_01_FULL_50_24]